MTSDNSPAESDVLIIAEAGVARLGLQAILEHSDGPPVRVAGIAPDDLEEALKAPVPVAVVTGSQTTRLLREHADTVPFIVVIESPTNAVIVDMFAAGARGLVLSESAPTRLPEAVRTVRDGYPYIDPCATQAVLAMALMGRRSHGPFGLTAREQHVLAHMMEGAKNREIAERLDISPETVKSHVRSVMAKLDAVDRHHAVATAREFGLG